MIIKIHCKNIFLLDILHKNPNTDFGLYAKELKNGSIIGNAIDQYNYHVIFQDTKYSYLPEESNQIDYQSYCSPLAILHINTEFFNQLLKLEKEEYLNSKITWLDKTFREVDTEECIIEIPNFFIQSSWYNKNEFLLCKYFSEIEINHNVGNSVNLKIKGKNVFHAINLLTLISLFTQITNNYGIFTYITDDFASKYVRILTNIENVPYFIFYLFIKRCIKSEKQFLVFKNSLENYFIKQGYSVNFTYWDTHEERKQFIIKELDIETPILDIGCGELQYFKRFISKGFTKNYYAVDEDESIEDIANHLRRVNDYPNLFFYNSIDELVINENVNIIITEVIEHNSIAAAAELIKNAININFKKIIITKPNQEFNQYFFDGNSMRHEDHDFEFNTTEFRKFIDEIISSNNKKLKSTFIQIGDSINSIQPTQCFIITPN